MTASPGLTELLALEAAAQDLLFRRARTANTFSAEPVDDQQLQAIYDLFKWAPTSSNSQPLRLTAVRTAHGKRRLIRHLAGGNQAKTAGAPLSLILSTDLHYHRHLNRLLPYQDNPAARHADDDFRRSNGDFNAALQAGYLILAIRAAGLAAGPLLGFDADALDKDFFPDGRRHSILVINVGHPGTGAWFSRLPRLEFTEVVDFA